MPLCPYKFFLFLLFFACACFSGSAQSSLNLSVTDARTIYQEMETLQGFGLVPSAIIAQRPWSAHEIETYLSEAETRLPKLCDKRPSTRCTQTQADLKEHIQSIKAKLKPFITHTKKPMQIFAPQLHTRFAYLDSPDVNFRVSNGIGLIQAKENPFTNFSAGQHFVDGSQYNLDFSHGLQLSPYFSAYAQHRFENLFPRQGQEETNYVLHKAYGKLEYKNWQLQIGRESLAWGQSENGGLMLTNHARPFDMISLGNDAPVVLPWIFKYMGPINVTTFIAHLGEDSYFPNGFLAGYKVSLKPIKIWEFGMSNLMMFGGEGSPQTDFIDYVGDFLGFAGTSNSISNRIFCFDGAMTFPFLRHTRFYTELAFDDKSVEAVARSLFDSAAYTGGFFIPRINSSGTLQLRLEATYTSQLFYHHWQFLDGMTLDGLLFGDPLGPDGYRLQSKWYWQKNQSVFTDFTTTFEGRDSNTYGATTDRFEVLSDNPTEKRLRNTAHLRKTWHDAIYTDVTLGHELVWDFAFQDGVKENNYFLGLNAVFDLDRLSSR